MPAFGALAAHLAGGATTVSRCWAVTRKDGMQFCFTDHDVALEFEGMVFLPDTGMTARALEQTTGLSVDNTEALGVLSSDAVTEADIQAGRFDGALVRAWLVNWADISERIMQFSGSIGEIQRSNGAFQAELRGLTEALNQPQGRVFQKPCSAVLGDGKCRFDLGQPGYFSNAVIEGVQGRKHFQFSGLDSFEDRWFERGTMRISNGAGVGLIGIIKNDHIKSGIRNIELWEVIRADVAIGDSVRIEAGCDRRVETCKLKFHNFVNYQGFPGIPGEDWLMSVPREGGTNDGGSLS